LIDSDDSAKLYAPISFEHRQSESSETRQFSSTVDSHVAAMHQNLIAWFQRKLQPLKIPVDTLTGSFSNGQALDAILRFFLPQDEYPGISAEVNKNCAYKARPYYHVVCFERNHNVRKLTPFSASYHNVSDWIHPLPFKTSSSCLIT